MEHKEGYGLEQTDVSSAYNEAGLQIQRLHNLWLSTETSSTNRNHVRWSSTLDAIERELYSDIKKRRDSNTILEKLSKLKKEYYLKTKYIKIGSMGIRMKGSNVGPCMFALDKRHKVLKQIQEDSGKGGIYRDTGNEDFED